MEKNLRMPIISVLILALILALLLDMETFAAPMPPRPIVNHQNKQCAVIVTGDECGDVVLPPDWEYLAPDSGEQCPADYAQVELSPEWVHFKTSFCCTEGHSGSSGDCQDLVIHNAEKQCAFVADSEHCTGLPAGWEASGENCPSEFKWVEDVACIGGEAGDTMGTPAVIPQTELPANGLGKITPTSN